eukprot:6207967-Pleurochrysis_carterae.AAC.1
MTRVLTTSIGLVAMVATAPAAAPQSAPTARRRSMMAHTLFSGRSVEGRSNARVGTRVLTRSSRDPTRARARTRGGREQWTKGKRAIGVGVERWEEGRKKLTNAYSDEGVLRVCRGDGRARNLEQFSQDVLVGGQSESRRHHARLEAAGTGRLGCEVDCDEGARGQFWS